MFPTGFKQMTLNINTLMTPIQQGCSNASPIEQYFFLIQTSTFISGERSPLIYESCKSFDPPMQKHSSVWIKGYILQSVNECIFFNLFNGRGGGGKTTSNIFYPFTPKTHISRNNQTKHFSLEQILSIPFLKGNNNPVITKQAVPLIWYHCKSKSFI